MTNTTTAVTFREGTIIQPTPTDTVGLRVCPPVVADLMCLPTELVEAGWQVAEYNHTGNRVLVRVVDPEGVMIPVWGILGVEVEVAQVETTVAEVNGRWAVVADKGEVLPRRWVARRDQVVVA